MRRTVRRTAASLILAWGIGARGGAPPAAAGGDAPKAPAAPGAPGTGDAPLMPRAQMATGDKGPGDAVHDALSWLAAHQSPRGPWEAAGFGNWCDGKPAAAPANDGAGKTSYDVGVTGLAVLAILGAGYAPGADHPFSACADRALRWLRSRQTAEGSIGDNFTGHHVYCHAIAAQALLEAYGMAGGAALHDSAQKALDFIAVARNPYMAWRYGTRSGENDTSVTGWMGMALFEGKLLNNAAMKAGRRPPFLMDMDAFDGIKAWLDKMTDPDYGRVGYIQRGSGSWRPAELSDPFPIEKSEAMTAIALLLRVFGGEDPNSVVNPSGSLLKKSAALLVKVLPGWNPADGSIDMYYWYYGSYALFQVGGDAWKKWDAAIKKAVLPHQRKDGDRCQYGGSWDPVDPWGPDGGRVYSTAMMALCLEACTRYARVSGK